MHSSRRTLLLLAITVPVSWLSEISKAKSKIEKSKIVGKSLGEKLISKKIEKIIFDRNGYRFHGRVKALADSVREIGIKI